MTLEELSDADSQSDADLELPGNLPEGGEKPPVTRTTDERVDCLVSQMDKFFKCFKLAQKSASKQQRNNDRKFKHLESAHNELVTKIVSSTSSNDSRIKALKERLLESEGANKELAKKITSLEANQERQFSLQHTINVDTSKKINTLEMDYGYVNNEVVNLGSEVKERKVIISRVKESKDEDVYTVALECINKVINQAITDLHPDASLNGLKILMPEAIDNVFRLGKKRSNNSRGIISVTFSRMDYKTMVNRALATIKNKESLDFTISDDLTHTGRTVKAQLKRVSVVAKLKGKEAKLAGNKVMIDNRAYLPNELSLIPKTVNDDLKQERVTDDEIIYRGDRTIFSNFFPAPFRLDGIDFEHVEQFYQYSKACHHEDDPTAERILKLSNPWRIKVLGDSIEAKQSWIEKRMKVMYDGVSAKFRQNRPLEDELLRSRGLKLCEATTDLYWACGLSFESKKWDTKDWQGENVAG